MARSGLGRAEFMIRNTLDNFTVLVTGEEDLIKAARNEGTKEGLKTALLLVQQEMKDES